MGFRSNIIKESEDVYIFEFTGFGSSYLSKHEATNSAILIYHTQSTCIVKINRDEESKSTVGYKLSNLTNFFEVSFRTPIIKPEDGKAYFIEIYAFSLPKTEDIPTETYINDKGIVIEKEYPENSAYILNTLKFDYTNENEIELSSSSLGDLQIVITRHGTISNHSLWYKSVDLSEYFSNDMLYEYNSNPTTVVIKYNPDTNEITVTDRENTTQCEVKDIDEFKFNELQETLHNYQNHNKEEYIVYGTTIIPYWQIGLDIIALIGMIIFIKNTFKRIRQKINNKALFKRGN